MHAVTMYASIMLCSEPLDSIYYSRVARGNGGPSKGDINFGCDGFALSEIQ